MSTSSEQQACAARCWKLAVLGGVVIAVLLIILGGLALWKAIVVGILVFAAGGVGLRRFLCVEDHVQNSIVTPAQAPSPEPESAATKASEPEPTAEPEAKATAPEKPANTDDEPLVKPSSLLAGEQELASRKGTWKYEGGAEKAADTAPAAAGSDDLKKISGVGPALEKKLHAADVTSFAQIAGWSDDEVVRMDDVLSFKGRITRDNWIEQATILAAGGETEFSKRKK